MLNATRLSGDGVEQRSVSSTTVGDSNSFPYVLSAWWSPTSQWSFNAGFAEMDSWINQQIVAVRLGLSAAHRRDAVLYPGDVQQPLGRGQPGHPLRLDPEVLDLCHVRVCPRRERHRAFPWSTGRGGDAV